MDGGDPRISVVMITYNRRDEALRTLDELARLPERPHVVLVDNASTDGTVAAVAQRHPGVTLLPQSRNLGAAARNIGLRATRTPYVALCDDDTWWEPGHLARAADLLDAHPRIAIVTGSVWVGPEERLDPICRELAASPVPADPGLPGKALLGFLAGASVVRRTAILDVGGFEPRFFVGGEEELLAVDLAVDGWTICYAAELRVHHYPSEYRDSRGRRRIMLRNALWFALLRRPRASVVRRTFQLIRSAPRDRATLAALVAALAGLPWVLRRRRPVPSHVDSILCLLEAPAFLPEAVPHSIGHETLRPA